MPETGPPPQHQPRHFLFLFQLLAVAAMIGAGLLYSSRGWEESLEFLGLSKPQPAAEEPGSAAAGRLGAPHHVRRAPPRVQGSLQVVAESLPEGSPSDDMTPRLPGSKGSEPPPRLPNALEAGAGGRFRRPLSAPIMKRNATVGPSLPGGTSPRPAIPAQDPARPRAAPQLFDRRAIAADSPALSHDPRQVPETAPTWIDKLRRLDVRVVIGGILCFFLAAYCWLVRALRKGPRGGGMTHT